MLVGGRLRGRKTFARLQCAIWMETLCVCFDCRYVKDKYDDKTSWSVEQNTACRLQALWLFYLFCAVLSLQDLCCRSIVSCTPVHLVDKLPLPVALKSHLKSFSMANGLNARMMHGRSYSVIASSAKKRNGTKKSKLIYPPLSPSQNCAQTSCKIS